MSQIFVCVIKREKHTIPPAFLEQIAQLLEVDIRDLLVGTKLTTTSKYWCYGKYVHYNLLWQDKYISWKSAKKMTKEFKMDMFCCDGS